MLLLSKSPGLMATLRADTTARIDGAAEQARLRHITPGAGQARAYERKRAQAEAVIAEPNIDPAKVPHIAGEAELNGVSLVDMAKLIIETAERKDALCAAIDIARLAAKKAVRAGATPAEIEAAEAAFVATMA
jgi:hypothetical protein